MRKIIIKVLSSRYNRSPASSFPPPPYHILAPIFLLGHRGHPFPRDRRARHQPAGEHAHGRHPQQHHRRHHLPHHSN
jgi:hypothetical protein